MTRKRRRFHKVLPCPCCGSDRISIAPESQREDMVRCTVCGLRATVSHDWLWTQPEFREPDKTECHSRCQREAVRRWNVRSSDQRRLVGLQREVASMIRDCVSDLRWGISNDTDEGDQSIVDVMNRLDGYAATLRATADSAEGST